MMVLIGIEILEGEILGNLALEAAVRIETGAKCLKRFAAIAAKSAKYLLDPQVVNRFTAAIVLRKWVTEDPIHEDLMIGIVPPRLRAEQN
jgi:hypothetical protein